jgi:hypothetical protein
VRALELEGAFRSRIFCELEFVPAPADRQLGLFVAAALSAAGATRGRRTGRRPRDPNFRMR